MGLTGATTARAGITLAGRGQGGYTHGAREHVIVASNLNYHPQCPPLRGSFT